MELRHPALSARMRRSPLLPDPRLLPDCSGSATSLPPSKHRLPPDYIHSHRPCHAAPFTGRKEIALVPPQPQALKSAPSHVSHGPSPVVWHRSQFHRPVELQVLHSRMSSPPPSHLGHCPVA